MSKPDVIFSVFVTLFLAFVAWSIVRNRRWEKYQREAANRAKTIIEAASQDRERASEAMAISREHLQATKELLSEVKGLRDDLKAGRNLLA
jgi:uncharacterized membrane protein YccC